MIRKIPTSILAACVLALTIAGPATAAPNRSAQLSSEKTTFDWQGDPVTAVGVFFDETAPADSCGAVGPDALDKCDTTLVTLDGPGSLDVQLPEAGDGITNDWDLYVYESDDEGSFGTEVGSSLEVGAPEAVPVDVPEAGSYLVVAIPFASVNGGYSGALTFTPAETA